MFILDYQDRTIANIVFKDGAHVTQIIKDGVIIKELPTHKSQIRKERKSLLWVPSTLGGYGSRAMMMFAGTQAHEEPQT